VIPRSIEGVSSNFATNSSKEGVNGDKKRRKQRLQGATTIGHDDGNDREGERL
jgi:hypothetical protein